MAELVNVQGTDDSGNLIVKVLNPDPDGMSAAARALLYNAAPELLEACEAIAALADGQGRANMMHVAAQARAALRKAGR